MSEISERLQAAAGSFGGRVREMEDLRGGAAYEADAAVAHEFLARLRQDEVLKFDFLVVLTAHDNYLDEPRFAVVYVVRSIENNLDVRVNVPVAGEDPELSTVTDIWPTANWLEREVYDMFGIRFKGHPDLTRILMWEGFEGWPLRKDYPLLGNTPGTPGHVGKGGKR